MKEIWKSIDGLDNYLVSNYGKVKHLAYEDVYVNGVHHHYPEVILTPHIYGGYYCVGIHYRDSSGVSNYKLMKIHRLVALAFISNPNNYPCINHKDENKLNNCVDNLEWCTYKYNANYGTRNTRMGNKLKGRKMSDEAIRKRTVSRGTKYRGENSYWYGKHHSDETKKKLSMLMSGENAPNYGKTLSEETRKKMSESGKIAWEKRRLKYNGD